MMSFSQAAGMVSLNVLVLYALLVYLCSDTPTKILNLRKIHYLCHAGTDCRQNILQTKVYSYCPYKKMW